MISYLQDIIADLTLAKRNFNYLSWLSPLIIGSIPVVIATLNNTWTYKRENIKELKEITKFFIDAWSELRTTSEKIINNYYWIQNKPELVGPNQVLQLEKEIREHQQTNQAMYIQVVKHIGYLYFYFDGYYMQNKIDAYFENYIAIEWNEMTFDGAHQKLHELQNEGSALLFEIKEEIKALASGRPRPFFWIKVRMHFLYLKNEHWLLPLRDTVSNLLKRTIKRHQYSL